MHLRETMPPLMHTLRRGVVGTRRVSTLVKASPTVQRLIRAAGLEDWPFDATGPKGLVTEEDVVTARTSKDASAAAAQAPVTIELAPLTTHLMEGAALPTSAVTNKAELMKYYETMCIFPQRPQPQAVPRQPPVYRILPIGACPRGGSLRTSTGLCGLTPRG